VKKFVFLFMPLTALAFFGLLALYRMAKLALPAPKEAEQTPSLGSDVRWM
jgi:hypothetical protein